MPQINMPSINEAGKLIEVTHNSSYKNTAITTCGVLISVIGAMVIFNVNGVTKGIDKQNIQSWRTV